MARAGYPIARSTLCTLFHRTAEQLTPLYAEMRNVVRSGRYVHADETGQPILDKDECFRGWMWVMLSPQAVVYHYLPNAWGLHDVHGNLGEWVNDLFDGLGYGEGPLTDPRGTLTPGATFCSTPPRSSSASSEVAASPSPATPTAADRGGAGRSFMSSSSVGFRLVRTVGVGK